MTAQKPYFPILEAEISRTGIRKKDIADAVGLCPKAFSNKITGKNEFCLNEIKIICSLFPNITPLELFSHAEDTETS